MLRSTFSCWRFSTPSTMMGRPMSRAMFTMDSRMPMPFCSSPSPMSKKRISILITSTETLLSIFREE